MIALDSYRQSILASMETCPRRTRAALETPDDLPVGYVEAAGHLGTLVHDVLAEIMRTLRRQGERQIPTQEAVEIMREVYSISPITLPSQERDDLRWMVLKFCEYVFEPEAILAIEQPLETVIVCPDGEPRVLTGRPDLLLRDGDRGIVINDWKSGRAVPRSPRTPPPEGEPIQGKQYLSDRGHFQLDCYGLLALESYPAAQYAILRELHLRSGEIREAVLGRGELEHVSYELGAHMQKLARALEEGEDSALWGPRPGRHCAKQCPVAASCPIPAEQRGLGLIGGEGEADDQAARYVVVDALRQQMRGQLKAWHEETGLVPAVGDGTGLYWRTDEKGKRAFGVWPLEAT
jgi:PD-(D/E)XK nuclease superfamily